MDGDDRSNKFECNKCGNIIETNFEKTLGYVQVMPCSNCGPGTSHCAVR